MSPSHSSLRLLCPRLAWLLGLLLLAGPSGCGPASPGDPSNIESRTAVSRPAYAPEARSTGRGESNLIPPLASIPAPLAPRPAPAGHGDARPAEPLVVPDSLSDALASPDVRVRLQALDRWAPQNQEAEVDSLMVALEDDDEQVRAKALAMLEQDWEQGQAATER